MRPLRRAIAVLFVGVPFLLVGYCSTDVFAQSNVGIGTTTPAASAILDLTSTTQGLLVPRMSNYNAAITSPSNGLLVYDNVKNTFYYYNNTAWVPFLSNTTGWLTLGNAGTVAGTNFLGTTDAIDFRIRTNNVERVAVTSAGLVGVGTNAPASKFTVLDGNQLLGATANQSILTSDAEGIDIGGSLGLGGNRTAASPTPFAQISGRKENATSGGNEGYLQLATLNGSNVMLEGMRMNSSQDVSIGSAQSATAATSPAKLSITQTATSTQKALLVTQNGAALFGNTQYATYSVATGAGSNNVAGYFSSTNATVGNYGLLVANGNVGVGTVTPAQKVEIVGNTKLDATGGVASQLQFQNPAGTFNTTFAAGAQVANIAYVLPTAQGGASTYLQNDGAGNLSWAAAGGIGASAWNLTGNSGTTAGTNFLGTTDAKDMVFKTNAVEAYRITSGGLVGFGLTVPTQKVEVSGNVKIDAITGVASQLQFQNPAATFNTTFAAGAQLAAIAYTLPIAQGAANTMLTNNGAGVLSWTSPGALDWSLLGNAGTTPGTNFLGTTDAQALVFKTNNTEAYRVTSAGLLGVGVVAPTQKLEVSGNVKVDAIAGVASQLQFQNPAATFNTTFAAGAQLANIAYTLPIAQGAANTVMTNNGAGVLSWAAPVTSATAWQLLGNAGTVAGTNFLGTTDNIDMVFKTNAVEGMRLSTAGFLGIGTAAPTSELHTVASGAKVAGFTGNLLTNVATSSTASITKYGTEVLSTGTWNGTTAVNVGLHVNATGGTTNYSGIFEGGNVGINTTAPLQKLDVKNGNVLLSNSGTADTLIFSDPNSSVYSSFVAQAQTKSDGTSASIRYTLPDTLAADDAELVEDFGTGKMRWRADHHYNINAASVSGTTNALAIPANGTFFLITGSATPVINGIAANASMDGRMIMLCNTGATTITVTNASGTGTAKIQRYSGAGNLSLVQYMTLTIVYDATNGVWHSLN